MMKIPFTFYKDEFALVRKSLGYKVDMTYEFLLERLDDKYGNENITINDETVVVDMTPNEILLFLPRVLDYTKTYNTAKDIRVNYTLSLNEIRTIKSWTHYAEDDYPYPLEEDDDLDLLSKLFD